MAELTRPAAPPPLSRHGAWILLGLLAFAVFGGGLIAPWIFNGVLRLGRAVKALDFLREVEFESVVSRCVLVLLIAGLFPAARLAGFQRFRDLGFGGTPPGAVADDRRHVIRLEGLRPGNAPPARRSGLPV